jgi:hypothetical protein
MEMALALIAPWVQHPSTATIILTIVIAQREWVGMTVRVQTVMQERTGCSFTMIRKHLAWEVGVNSAQLMLRL